MRNEDIEYLFKHFYFCQESGKLTIKERPRGTARKVGDQIGYDDKDGYLRFKLRGKRQLVHRVGFFMSYGWWPECIDHINGDKKDNRIINLRPATKAENCRNRKTHKNSSSKYKGVSRVKTEQIWRSSIFIDGKSVILYSGDNELEAAKSYDEAAILHFGEFAKTNKSMGLI